MTSGATISSFRNTGARRQRQVIAHAGGIDEIVFILIPLLVFLALQWMNRRRGNVTPDTDDDARQRLERRQRLAGGLIPNPETDRPNPDDPPEGTASG